MLLTYKELVKCLCPEAVNKGPKNIFTAMTMSAVNNFKGLL